MTRRVPPVEQPTNDVPRDGGTAILPDAATARRRRRSSGTKQVIEWVLLIGTALAIALIIKTFLFQAFYIPSESMVPTLKVHDRVLVNKLSYKLHDIHRGDIVVFTKPKGEASDIKDLIKRVVGLPGETVEVRDCKVLINGNPLDEPYVKQWTRTCTFAPKVVGDNQVFVMGDNRDDSQDSRFFGPISEDLIVGRAFIVVWPLSNLGWL